MPNKILTANFTTSGVPTVGLTPTIDIFDLTLTPGGGSTQVVFAGATTAIGKGWYRYDFQTYLPTHSYLFTFDGGSLLSSYERYQSGGNESYVEDISTQVWNTSAIDYTLSGSTGLALNQIKADTSSIAISETTLATLLNTLLKYERNRTKIDTNAATMTIFDDDCVTPLTVFNLRDFHGLPSVQEVCERVPQGC